MSTEWFYRIDMKLGVNAPRDADLLLGGLEPLLHPRHLPIPPDRAEAPEYGPGLVHGGRDYSNIVGARVEKGRLRMGIWAQNLDRSFPVEGAELMPNHRRLDALLAFFSRYCDEEPGTVVGCIESENDEGHTHPLIVCRDGAIRRAWTPSIPFGYRDAGEPLAIGDVLPIEVLEVRNDHEVDLDVEDLKYRLKRVPAP